MLEPGSIIHGTLQLVDLIPAVLDAPEEVDETRAAVIREEYSNTLWALDMAECDWDLTMRTLLDAIWLFGERLTPAMNENAPEYYYFGSHEGDGSDIGIWLCCTQCDEREEGCSKKLDLI